MRSKALTLRTTATIDPRVHCVIHIFYYGSPVGQGRWKSNSATKKGRPARGGMCPATLPADRFVGLVPSTAGRDAVVRTRSLTTSGRCLLLNAEFGDTRDIRVELLDENGDVLPHFGRAESRLIVHDRLRYRVAWQDGARELSFGDAVTERPVMLRFVIRGGALFAFQIIE